MKPLKIRDFRLLFAGRLVNSLGDAVTPAALALAVVTATGSATALALVLGAALLPRLLLLPIGGTVADRWNPRRVAVLSDVVRCLAQLVVGVEFLTGQMQLSHLIVAGAVSGAASAFAIPAGMPLVAGTVDDPDARHAANALLAVARNVTQLAGPLLSGVLIFTVGAGWTFVLDAASFAVSAALLGLIRPRHVPLPKQTMLADLAEGWAELRSRTWYWTSLIAHACWNFSFGVFATLGPLLAVRHLGGEATWIAILQAGAIGLVVGSLVAGRYRPYRPILVGNAGGALYAIPLVLLAFTAPAPWVIAGYGVGMVALGFLNPVWETEIQRRIPQQVLARVISYDYLISLAVMPLGYLVGPLLAEATTPAVPLVGAAVLLTVTTLGTALIPDVRRQTSTPEPERERELVPA